MTLILFLAIRLSRGRSSLQDEFRKGGPKSVVIPKTIDAVHQMCIDALNSIFDDEAPSRTSVYRWYGEFNRGRCSLQN